LELAAADDGGVVEIAKRGDVDDVAEDAALAGFAVNGAVDFGGVGCGDDEEDVVEICGAEGTLGEVDFLLFAPLKNLGCGLWCDDVYLRASFEKAGDFAFADFAGADDEAASAVELQE